MLCLQPGNGRKTLLSYIHAVQEVIISKGLVAKMAAHMAERSGAQYLGFLDS